VPVASMGAEMEGVRAGSGFRTACTGAFSQ
jgi:hypothetical protein